MLGSMVLENVLWIGGGRGAGKTSIARTLAHRHDLAFYRVDAYNYEHTRRLDHSPGSPDERFLQPTPEEMAKRFVDAARHRFHLIIEDLRARSTSFLVIAEGPQLLPSLVAPYLASSGNAVWLQATATFRERTLAERGAPPVSSNHDRALRNLLERDRILDRFIRSGAERLGLTIMTVDGSRDLASMIDDIGDYFADSLASGPRIPDGRQLRRVRRIENIAMVNNYMSYLVDIGDGEAHNFESLPFGCECWRLGCQEVIEATVSDFETIRNAGEFLGHRGGMRQ